MAVTATDANSNTSTATTTTTTTTSIPGSEEEELKEGPVVVSDVTDEDIQEFQNQKNLHMVSTATGGGVGTLERSC